MSKQLKTKLERLEQLYTETKELADQVPALERKVAELKGALARSSSRVITEDIASEIADSLVAEGFVKSASRDEFASRILDHPEELAESFRKIASLQGGPIQVGSSDHEYEESQPFSELDPLSAFALS